MHLRTRKRHIDRGVVAQPVECRADRLGGYGFNPRSGRLTRKGPNLVRTEGWTDGWKEKSVT